MKLQSMEGTVTKIVNSSVLYLGPTQIIDVVGIMTWPL